jgi:3-deoxy-7-phosphoheptulonate synthase
MALSLFKDLGLKPDLNDDLIFIAGPCAIESESSALLLAQKVKKAGARIFRGQIFKTRTSPYSFQGIGIKGLSILEKIKKQTNMPIITEVLSIDQVGPVSQVADIIQIGARNMQNTPLLKAAAESGRPVFLKRGFSSSVDEWLNSSEYIFLNNNHKVILCERGIRTFETCTKSTLSFGGALDASLKTGLPVFIDPSHGSGRSDLIENLSLAAVAAGFKGLMIETHENPSQSLSDPDQAVTPKELARIIKKSKKIYHVLFKNI